MTRLLVRIHRLYGLPLPDTELPWQVGRQRYRLDFAWPAVMLAVEVDGYAWHAAPSDLDHDTARGSQLTAAGWTILVFTWHQVVQDPERVTATILATFARCQDGADC